MRPDYTDELLLALKAHVSACPRCYGSGTYRSRCTLCGDSTYDHYCDDKDLPCEPCRVALKIIATVP